MHTLAVGLSHCACLVTSSSPGLHRHIDSARQIKTSSYRMLCRSAAPGKLAAQWQAIGMSKIRHHRCREIIQVISVCTCPCVEALIRGVLGHRGPSLAYFLFPSWAVPHSCLAPMHGLLAKTITASCRWCAYVLLGSFQTSTSENTVARICAASNLLHQRVRAAGHHHQRGLRN